MGVPRSNGRRAYGSASSGEEDGNSAASSAAVNDQDNGGLNGNRRASVRGRRVLVAEGGEAIRRLPPLYLVLSLGGRVCYQVSLAVGEEGGRGRQARGRSAGGRLAVEVVLRLNGGAFAP